jgi:hypothetical protein
MKKKKKWFFSGAKSHMKLLLAIKSQIKSHTKSHVLTAPKFWSDMIRLGLFRIRLQFYDHWCAWHLEKMPWILSITSVLKWSVAWLESKLSISHSILLDIAQSLVRMYLLQFWRPRFFFTCLFSCLWRAAKWHFTTRSRLQQVVKYFSDRWSSCSWR